MFCNNFAPFFSGKPIFSSKKTPIFAVCFYKNIYYIDFQIIKYMDKILLLFY